ncbi:uncharacterized protein LOC127135743 [Lathyrus oleraceus]|uniref:uncharacterized protein LOC127135743 n=1 Tax=Pisum sativum TaxID=3888 RepID=UPI0021D17046|nr:uncharacterized protein LOC127135743 [Pisum sativum]
MGNCCKAASSMEWGGEDWESLRPRKEPKPCCSSSSLSSNKVFYEAAHMKKKKEVASAEQVLDRLIKSKKHRFNSHWKPSVLDTIPEY